MMPFLTFQFPTQISQVMSEMAACLEAARFDEKVIKEVDSPSAEVRNRASKNR